MTGTHIQKVSTEQVLFSSVADLYLGNGDKVLVFANIICKAFVTKSVDFASNDKTIGPNLNEHISNIKFFHIGRRLKAFFRSKLVPFYFLKVF